MAIAACHACVKSAADTDLGRIAELARVLPTPVVEVNRAVAIFMAFWPAVGLEIADGLTSGPSLRAYHLLPSLRG